MKVLRVIRIETAPDGAVHLITESGDRVIVVRKTDGYSAARVVGTLEDEGPDRHLLGVEALPKRGDAPALF
jgi:hypothetical protein